MTKRTIIIVWGWKQSGVTPLDGHTILSTPHEDCLICADIPKDTAKQDMLTVLTNDHANDKSVLVFLHETAPHSYLESDRLQFLKGLEPGKARQVRARLFGGGKEPLYFSEGSLMGMLGIKGRFPKSIFGTEKKSNLLIEGQENKIRQEHFDYIWDIYWHPPYKLIFNLAERFRFWTDGCELDEGLDFSTHLKSYDLLRQRLLCFADKGSMEENIYAPFASDYNYDSYELLLRETNPSLFKNLQLTRKEVRIMLDAKPVNKKDAQDVVDKTFNALFGLFKEIAFGSV